MTKERDGFNFRKVRGQGGRAVTKERDGFNFRKVRGRGYHVSCTQCEALVINGVPCHETGCPNAKKREVGDDEEQDN